MVIVTTSKHVKKIRYPSFTTDYSQQYHNISSQLVTLDFARTSETCTS